MGNRFLRILRKVSKRTTVCHKHYQEMTHQEYVSEVSYLMDLGGVPRLTPQATRSRLEVFVVIHEKAA